VSNRRMARGGESTTPAGDAAARSGGGSRSAYLKGKTVGGDRMEGGAGSVR
jgi:hypothetical protein